MSKCAICGKPLEPADAEYLVHIKAVVGSAFRRAVAHSACASEWKINRLLEELNTAEAEASHEQT